MLYSKKGEDLGWIRQYPEMRIPMLPGEQKAQTALEYLLVLTTIAAIVLAGFKIYFPYIQDTSNLYYNRVVPGIMGPPPKCGDGVCTTVEGADGRCPVDCD